MMFVIPIAGFFLSLGLVFAHPFKSPHNGATNVQVLAFASLLEQLESAFYAQALEKFSSPDFETAGFASSQIPIQQFEMIASDENVHAVTLESAIHTLGGEVVSNCTFDFSSALTDVNTMVANARVVENVGVSAYLGALAYLTDPALVSAVGSIMTIEARHQTTLNLLSNATSIPQPFDVALAPADVLAIVNTFISGCSLSISANLPLTVTYNGTLQAGVQLNFSSPALNGTINTNQLSCHIMTGGTNASYTQSMNDCMVPVNVTGPMYVFITNDQMAVTSPYGMNETTNSSITVAGPALLFVDQPDSIGELIRPGSDPISTATPGNITMSSATPTTTATSTPPPTTSASNVSSPLTPSASAPPNASTTPTASSLTTNAFTTTLSPAQASGVLSSLVASINSLSL